MANDGGWQEAARGIPVWAGARSCSLGGFDAGIVVRVDGERVVFADGTRPRAGLIVDLSDPDTRAAYDRRLAIAWGAPEAHDTLRVSIVREGPLMSSIDILVDHPRGRFVKTIHVDTILPLLARALAWPADKRVTG